MLHQGSRQHRQIGMTLVEVMVSMVLVAILLIGMNSLWVVVARQFDDLVLRQKAIFRMNGEMERLAEIYRRGDSNGVIATNSTGYDTNPPSLEGSYIRLPDPRIIYARAAAVAVAPNSYVVTTGNNFQDIDNTLQKPEQITKAYQMVFAFDSGTNNADDDRNLVWLDRENMIVAQISWALTSINDTTGVARPCGPVGATVLSCHVLTLYLDYPFRYLSDLNPKEVISGIPVDTITLQTIVGQR